MMTSSNGNTFRVTGHLSGEFTRRGALMFSLICVWINGWVNNREGGNLRRYRAHYDVAVMSNLTHGSACIIGWKSGLLDILISPYIAQFMRRGRIHYGLNTLRPRQNGRHIPDGINKCFFLNENVKIPIEISMKCVPKDQINNISALVQIMAWRRLCDKPLSEPMLVNLLTHICVTWPQWVKVVFCFRHFTASHYHHDARLLTGVEQIACRVLSCGGVSNMWLVISITFHCLHIWGCLCSTRPFQFRWLKGYIYSSCYYHHKIGSINLTHCFHIFSVIMCLRCLLHHILSLIAYAVWENRDFVFIIIVQFMMSSNSRIRFGLQIVFSCLYITPSHYNHCANLSEDMNLEKPCQIYFVECVSKIEHILSVIRYAIYGTEHILSVIRHAIYGTVCFQFTHLPCDDVENICFVLLSSSNRKYEISPIV